MSDRYAVRIMIGGTIPDSKVALLAEAICDDGFGPDWDDYFEDADDAATWLRGGSGKGALAVQDNECSATEAALTARACLALGLVCVIHCDAGHGNNASLEWTTREGVHYVSANEEGDVLVPLDRVVDKLARGRLEQYLESIRPPTVPGLAVTPGE